MLKNNNVEEIKKLIIKGFDLELISFELDIPIEELEKLKEDMKKTQNNFSKMDQLRARYYKLYFSNSENFKADIGIKKLSKREENLINSVVLEIEKKINEMQYVSMQKRLLLLKEVLISFKNIEKINITIDQAEKVYDLMNLPQMEELMKMKKDKVAIIIEAKRRRTIKKLADAVDNEQMETEDIEGLKKLAKRLTSKTKSYDPIIFGVVNKIEGKILRIKQKSAIDKIKNDIPKNIEDIISKIASGTLDIEDANKTINREIKKQLKNGKFTLNEEQLRKRFLMQIVTRIEDKSEDYKIENPVLAIENLKELYNGKIEQPVRSVIHYLINIKDFEKAKEISEAYYKKYKNTELANYMILLKKEVKNAEISDFILKGIKMKGTLEQEKEYYELIRRGIKLGNVKITAVLLGKNQEETKNIYLSDIWQEKQNIRAN